MEIWKLIDGSETDYISNYGRVKTNDGFKKIYMNKLFPVVKIETTSKIGNRQLNTLVAQHFVSNPNGYRKVKHIDGDKSNCRFDNLEWISEKEAYEMINKAPKKMPIQVDCYTIEDEYVGRFSSIREASIKLNVAQPNIVAHLKGRNQRVENYKFFKV